MADRFTEQELEIAKSVDLTAVAEHLGYTVKKVGKYHTLKEMDSIRIYNRTHWCRWSRRYEKGSNGGSQIDFLRVFYNMDVKEAVFWLLDFAGYHKRSEDVRKPELKYQISLKHNTVKEEKKEFILPQPAPDNRYLYRYLCKERGLHKEIVDYFVDKGLIYESYPYHNIVFKGNDKEGITRFASMRGVFDRQGKPFKCDVAGNDKRYGFNIVHEDSEEVVVFEGAIDLLSYMDIFSDFHTNMIALGMLADAPLETFLEEHPKINTIRFCLDGDEQGRKTSDMLMEKYYGLGYEVENFPPPKGHKDINEWLVAFRKCEFQDEKRGQIHNTLIFRK